MSRNTLSERQEKFLADLYFQIGIPTEERDAIIDRFISELAHLTTPTKPPKHVQPPRKVIDLQFNGTFEYEMTFPVSASDDEIKSAAAKFGERCFSEWRMVYIPGKLVNIEGQLKYSKP